MGTKMLIMSRIGIIRQHPFLSQGLFVIAKPKSVNLTYFPISKIVNDELSVLKSCKRFIDASRKKVSYKHPSFRNLPNADAFDTVYENNIIIKETTKFDIGTKETYFATNWRPKTKIKGLIFLCHGYGDYIGPNYDEMAEYLCKNGYLVFGHDHVGHGRSSGPRVLVRSMSEYVNPVLTHINSLKNLPENINKPIFLLGNSMGGLISMFAILENQSLFSGFVGIAPLAGINTTIATPFRMLLVRMFKNICPNCTWGKLGDSASTRDEIAIKRNTSDLLKWQGGFKAGYAHVMFQSCKEIQNRFQEINLPILVFQGEKDEIVSPEASRKIFLESSSKVKEFILYPEAKHTLHIELKDIKEDMFGKILQWIEQRQSQSDYACKMNVPKFLLRNIFSKT